MVRDEIVIYYSKWDGKNGSHELLKQAVVKWCKIHRSMLEHSRIVLRQEETWKKPCFKYPMGVEFSISHTGKMWMCAISDTPVGLDVQEANRCKRDKLSKRFFHPEEDDWLSKNQYGGFFHVWAAKESYLKYTGDGLAYGMDQFCVADKDGFRKEINGVCQRHFVCSPQKDEMELKQEEYSLKGEDGGCLEGDSSEGRNGWRFEEYLQKGGMDILPEEERMALCISYKGEREIRFLQL